MHKAAITITYCIRLQGIEHHITASQPEKERLTGFVDENCYSIQEVIAKEYLKRTFGIQLYLNQIFRFLLSTSPTCT